MSGGRITTVKPALWTCMSGICAKNLAAALYQPCAVLATAWKIHWINNAKNQFFLESIHRPEPGHPAQFICYGGCLPAFGTFVLYSPYGQYGCHYGRPYGYGHKY